MNKNSPNHRARNCANKSHIIRFPYKLAPRISINMDNCVRLTDRYELEGGLIDLARPIDLMYSDNSTQLFMIIDTIHEPTIATIFDSTCVQNECELPQSPLTIFAIDKLSSEWGEVLGDCPFNYLDKCSGEVIQDERCNEDGSPIPKATIAHLRYITEAEHADLTTKFGNVVILKNWEF